VRVPALSLQSLIARHGQPAFIKLDIEGMELAALQGLETPPACLSFEFLAARPQDSIACLDRLDALGTWQFNLSRGEDLVMLWPDWVPRQQLDTWLNEHAGQDFSGDIYARHLPARMRSEENQGADALPGPCANQARGSKGGVFPGILALSPTAPTPRRPKSETLPALAHRFLRR